jgi:hypothetical protein
MILEEGYYLMGAIIGMGMVFITWFAKTGDLYPINMLIGTGIALATYSLIKNYGGKKWEN